MDETVESGAAHARQRSAELGERQHQVAYAGIGTQPAAPLRRVHEFLRGPQKRLASRPDRRIVFQAAGQQGEEGAGAPVGGTVDDASQSGKGIRLLVQGAGSGDHDLTDQLAAVCEVPVERRIAYPGPAGYLIQRRFRTMGDEGFAGSRDDPFPVAQGIGPGAVFPFRGGAVEDFRVFHSV